MPDSMPLAEALEWVEARIASLDFRIAQWSGLAGKHAGSVLAENAPAVIAASHTERALLSTLVAAVRRHEAALRRIATTEIVADTCKDIALRDIATAALAAEVGDDDDRP